MVDDLSDAPAVDLITDPADPRVDEHRDLRTRPERGSRTVVVEGHVAIRRLLASGLTVRSVLLTPRGDRLLAADLDGRAPRLVAEPDVVAAIVGFDLHRGSVAVAERPVARTVASVVAGARTIAILEGVNDHENLGAVIRSAVALGVDGLLLSPDCADPLYRRSIRVSMGWALTLPTARLGSWPGALTELRRQGWDVVALSPVGSAPPLTGERTADDQVALLLGAEGAGLTEEARRAATRAARIPMAAGVDSLNVASAAAIAFHVLVPASARDGAPTCSAGPGA